MLDEKHYAINIIKTNTLSNSRKINPICKQPKKTNNIEFHSRDIVKLGEIIN